MNKNAQYYREQIASIKAEFMRGDITYLEAKRKAAPVIAEMNERAKKIAVEYGARFKPFSFTSLFR